MNTETYLIDKIDEIMKRDHPRIEYVLKRGEEFSGVWLILYKRLENSDEILYFKLDIGVHELNNDLRQVIAPLINDYISIT